MKRNDCRHRRTSHITEERYEPLFGLETPVEVIVYRICDDCGERVGAVVDARVISADPALASLYGEPCQE